MLMMPVNEQKKMNNAAAHKEGMENFTYKIARKKEIYAHYRKLPSQEPEKKTSMPMRWWYHDDKREEPQFERQQIIHRHQLIISNRANPDPSPRGHQ